MATPHTPPPPPPKPAPPPPPKPEAAKPHDPHADPQDNKPKAKEAAPEFHPKPALDPRAEKPPAGAYADGMGIADEQRARSAWIEAHGMKAYQEAIDGRTDEEKAPKQVPGVVPPTKRE